MFPKVRETYGNLQTAKALAKIFAKHKLVDCKRQLSNLKSLYFLQTFQQIKPTFETIKCGKSCFCCDYIIEGELFKFQNWYQPFISKSIFNCETPNFIYVIICSSWKDEYIGQSGQQHKERLSIYRDHIRQPEYEKTEVERHLRTYSKGVFTFFPFFKKKENDKI